MNNKLVAGLLAAGAASGALIAKPSNVNQSDVTTDVQLARAEYRFNAAGEVAVFHCFKTATGSTGCPDAPLIDFQKTLPLPSDIQKAFVKLYPVTK